MIIVPSQPIRLSEAPAAAGRPSAAMIAFFSRWRRNKSLLRSSSGPCYPYPRSHSTVMVVPSGRPQEEPPPMKTQQPRRRPPLNRAIPTIPESRSNESIMSHASRASQSMDTPAVDCVVIENRAAVERLPLGSKQTMRRSVAQKKATTPRSPLLSVAHTVRDKLSRFTKRKAPPETSAGGVRSSQSFSGFRAPPPPTPRVDENSNRVIKSSSMEAPLSDRPSTSKVVIPQCPEPLFAEESSEAGEIPASPTVPSASAAMDPPSTVSPPPTSPPSSPEVRVSLKSDVLVVTELSPATSTEQPTTVIVAERPRELPVSVVYALEPLQQKVNTEADKENDRPVVETKTTVTVTETVVIGSPKQKGHSDEDKAKSPERFVMTVKTPEAQRKHRAFVVEERPPEVAEVAEERVEVIEEEVITKRKEKREDSKSPERYVLTVKSPESQRHRLFTVQQKSEDEILVETRGRTDCRRAEEKAKRKKEVTEETKSPERYVMTVKTPEPLRKHRVLTIAEAPSTESKKMTRSRSEERPTLRIWTNLRKTLALRRTQTFSSATMEEHKTEEPKSQSVERKRKEEEEEDRKERFVIVAKTPQSLRRHHTFMVGDRPRSPDVPWIEEGLLTEPIATVGPQKKKRTRSEEPRKEQKQEETAERFVMTTRTPLTMRKYQTFVVETKKPVQLPTSASADAVELERRGDQLLKELDTIYPTSSRLDQRESQVEENSRISTKDMYILTSTTPQLRRRDRDEVSSPTLFVLGKRPLERPIEDERRLEAVRECSQSDRAELKSAASGELTSLEEDIPMDTTQEEHVRPVVAVLPLTSRPVPSPKTARKKKKSSVAARLATQPQNQRDHRLLRGLRSAGKIFSPSFLKNRKPPPPSSASLLTSTYPSVRAPLAEGESSVVANSPMVETLPIETWNTPRPRGSPPRGFAALIREENNDANGNPQTDENGPAPSSPQLLHRGLIDDEILDQPMLVGDSFSHSESSDRLSERAHAVVNGEQPRRPDVSSPVSFPRNEVVDESLAQVAQIKSQLLDLQSLIHENSPPSETLQDVAALAQENDSLRRQLVERDKLIDNLRAQLAQLRPVPV